MNPPSTSLVVLSGLAAVIVGFYVTRRQQPLPPGPPRLPILGNALQMPTQREWLTFSEWAKKYGIYRGFAFRQLRILIPLRRRPCLRVGAKHVVRDSALAYTGLGPSREEGEYIF